MNVSTTDAELRATGVLLDNGMVFDEVIVRAGEVRYDADRRAFFLPGRARAVARITSDAIAHFVQENPPSAIQDLSVELQSGKVKVKARMQGLLPLGVEAVGRLTIVNGTQIAFVHEAVRVAGLGAPEGLVDRVLESVNPLLDLSGLPFPVQLLQIEVTPAEIRVEAEVGPVSL